MEFEFRLKNRVTWEFSGGEIWGGMECREVGKSEELLGDLEGRGLIVKNLSMFEGD